MATDSDGDGVNDSADDFLMTHVQIPIQMEMECQIQSVVLSSGTVAYIIEEPFTNGAKYFDTGSESVSRYLWNNANEPDMLITRPQVLRWLPTFTPQTAASDLQMEITLVPRTIQDGWELHRWNPRISDG